MSERYQVIPRTLCLVFHQNEILMIKGGPHKKWSGMYNALGGHVEKGESIIDSAKREIKEESGLEVKNTKLRGVVHTTGFFDLNVIMFVTSSYADSKNVTSNDEGELKWVKISDIDKINAFEDIKPIIKHVLEMKPKDIFIGTSKYDGKDNLISLDVKIE